MANPNTTPAPRNALSACPTPGTTTASSERATG